MIFETKNVKKKAEYKKKSYQLYVGEEHVQGCQPQISKRGIFDAKKRSF